jgi:hypothetical protein
MFCLVPFRLRQGYGREVPFAKATADKLPVAFCLLPFAFCLVLPQGLLVVTRKPIDRWIGL